VVYDVPQERLSVSQELQVIALGSSLVELTPRQTGADLTGADEYLALPSGAASNFAIALARLGVRVGLVTRVGDDELGQWLLGKLHAFGVVTEGLAQAVTGQLTPVSFGWMDGLGGKSFYFYRFPGHCDPMRELRADELGPELLGRARLFDFSEATVRHQPLRDTALQAACTAREVGARVVYAVNYRAGSWDIPLQEVVAVQHQAFALADIAVMNREEAQLFTGATSAQTAAEAVADLGPTLIAITDGENGAYVYREGEMHHVLARQVPVAYDIGAGDTFHAGLVAAYLAGMDAPQMGRFGCDAAALRISGGADMSCLPTWAQTIRFGSSGHAPSEAAHLDLL